MLIVKFYQSGLREFRKNFLMYVAQSILIQSCLGSLTAMAISRNLGKPTYFLELTLCICIAMLYNVAILAMFKAKLTYTILLLSLGINTILLIINL
tara:strand:- start:29725 stop:30012 length:288 start_codon:yes stop_codon:yes gene_type:complete